MRDEFTELLVETLPHLRAYARSLTRNADQGDDLVQDTAVRLINAREQYRPGTNFRAWAIAALRNRFVDVRRRSRFHGGSTDDLAEVMFAVPASQETLVYFDETARAFWRLCPAHREILTMIAINGMSYEQVATVLGCPIGTVRSRLARARAELQTAMDVTARKPRTVTAREVAAPTAEPVVLPVHGAAIEADTAAGAPADAADAAEIAETRRAA